MSAPQPGTPLPWEQGYGATCWYINGGVGFVCTMDTPDRFTQGANAAYIVHTANSHPKAQALADALRECFLQIAQNHGRKLTVAEEAALDNARAALEAWDAKP